MSWQDIGGDRSAAAARRDGADLARGGRADPVTRQARRRLRRAVNAGGAALAMAVVLPFVAAFWLLALALCVGFAAAALPLIALFIAGDAAWRLVAGRA